MASKSTYTPAQDAISSALSKAKINTISSDLLKSNIGFAVPDEATIAEWTNHFVPGVSYGSYFDALINAAKAEYGPTDPEVGHYIAQKAAWEDWSKSHTSLNDISLANSGGKTYSDLANQASIIRQTLAEQTKALNEAAKSGIYSQLNPINVSLYGTGTADNPTKGSLAYNYKEKQAALTKAQADIDAKPTELNRQPAALTAAQTALYGVGGTADKPAANSLASNYSTAVAQQKTLTDAQNAGVTPTEKAMYNAYDTYLSKAYTPYTNFIQGITPLPVVDTTKDTTKDTGTTGELTQQQKEMAAATAAATKDPRVQQALQSYITTGNMPTVDSTLVGATQNAIDKYMQQKTIDDAQKKAAAIAVDSTKQIAQTRGDISNYNALLAQAALKAPKVAESTTDVLKKMNEAKGETTPGMGLAQLTDYVGGTRNALGSSNVAQLTKRAPAAYIPPAQPAQQNQLPQMGLNLSQDPNTRFIQQELAAQQQLQHPGTYATGQFDPLYSGYLSSGLQYTNTQSSPMQSGGTWANGPLVAHPSNMGLGLQNLYDPNANVYSPPASPATTVGKSAGGYMDAQSVGQGNQALQQQQPLQQNNQLGLASIPNMSQYTNYTNNPGMASPTQNTDDGGVGGVSVLGQTNPMW
jgi:hypothetical protein